MVLDKQTEPVSDEYEVKIFNEMGTEVLSYPNLKEDSFTINVAHLSNGIYYVHIIQKGKLHRRQIIVE